MKNIILIGMPGCGKTAIGKIISQQLKLGFFDCDREITKAQSMSVSQIFDKYGEARFRSLESELILRLPDENFVVSTGGGVVENPENIKHMRNNGLVVFINRPVKMIAADIDISNRPLLKDGNNRLAALFERRLGLYQSACHIEVENTGTLADTAAKIIDEVTNNG